MHVIVAEIRIKPERRQEFLKAMLDDASGSVHNEPGCYQFSVVQDEGDPNRIFLFEVYRDKEAFAQHQQTPHYIRWRDTVQDWYAAPVQVTQGPNVYPEDSAWTR